MNKSRQLVPPLKTTAGADVATGDAGREGQQRRRCCPEHIAQIQRHMPALADDTLRCSETSPDDRALEMAAVAAELRMHTEKRLLHACINDGIVTDAPGQQ